MTSTTVTASPAVVRPEEMLGSLQWRYATKKFDPEQKIPQPVWNALEESLALSPSSYGLQPWKFFVVDDPAVRKKLKGASWNQSQIVDADKLVVFAVKKDFGPADVDRFIARVSEVRGAPASALEPYRQMMLGSITSRSPEAVRHWTARQVYISLGVFLTTAAVLGVDACPMEGIDSAQYDKILGLEETGYATLFVATAGCRAENDGDARLPKVRFSRDEVVEHV